MDNLINISPIDGRYNNICKKLSKYFSEYGLIRYRVYVEIKYFIELSKTLPELNSKENNIEIKLLELFNNFNLEEANKIKKIEQNINHDVKAIEYYLKDKFTEIGLEKYKEFIHFGLTSQDINNTSIPISLNDSLKTIFFPIYNKLNDNIYNISKKWIKIPMLSKTHGQPASPTYLGKEFMVFYERLSNEINNLYSVKLYGKFGGAIGNFNSLYISYPNIDWIKFSNDFLNNLGLKRNQYTKQIDHYDSLCNLFDNIRRINNILIDLNKDIWLYISNDYFKLKINDNEIGSSTMPHKVNPINFENSEANLQLSNALLNFLSNKLPISRLQRDLTDSTITRNIGLTLSYSYLAYNSLMKGLDKLEINIEKINQDLDNNWIIIGEAIQTILKKHNYPEPYELLKNLTRNNKKINKIEIHNFINSLNININLKKELLKITPFNYTGIIPKI